MHLRKESLKKSGLPGLSAKQVLDTFDSNYGSVSIKIVQHLLTSFNTIQQQWKWGPNTSDTLNVGRRWLEMLDAFFWGCRGSISRRHLFRGYLNNHGWRGGESCSSTPNRHPRGVLPHNTYTGMCRSTGSWFEGSWSKTEYQYLRRFLERGVILQTFESFKISTAIFCYL